MILLKILYNTIIKEIKRVNNIDITKEEIIEYIKNM